MLAGVVEDVHEGVADLPRRRELAVEIAIRPHRATRSSVRTIDRARHADTEPLHTARERAPVVRLDDEVKVITLHGELEEAKRVGRGAGEGRAGRGEHRVGPKTRAIATNANRHVNRTPSIVRRASQVDLEVTWRCGPAERRA